MYMLNLLAELSGVFFEGAVRNMGLMTHSGITVLYNLISLRNTKQKKKTILVWRREIEF